MSQIRRKDLLIEDLSTIKFIIRSCRNLASVNKESQFYADRLFVLVDDEAADALRDEN